MLVKSDTGPEGIMFLLEFRTVEDGYCSVKSDIDQGTTNIVYNVLDTGRTKKYFVI